ncbi:orotidine-5'-phosphate decarboxylase [bacterium]|nr:orotidine-5'-phosphate decarboxylase [bacterium]
MKRTLTGKDRLIVALDVSSEAEARALIEELRDEVGVFKCGLELFTSCGTALFAIAREYRVKLFFDAKFHDIPNTVAQACRAAVSQSVDIFNLHATGGSAMMVAAAEATAVAYQELLKVEPNASKPALIAVTILTSMTAKTLSEELNVSLPLDKMVTYLAKLAQQSKLDGVVASAQEATAIRESCGDDFLIITPGIRPSWAEANDQARIVTPRDAIARGADYIVVGRPIVKAPDRVAAARKIVEELST